MVAAYIQAWIGWWSKPFWAAPTTPIDPETGCFSFQYVTGGLDELAASMAVFLIPADYVPPLAGLHPPDPLPPEIFLHAVAYAIIDRPAGLPRLTVERRGDDLLALRVEGVPADSPFAIQSTSNLASGVWSTLKGSANIDTNGVFFAYRPFAGQRFFGAVCLPCQ